MLHAQELWNRAWNIARSRPGSFAEEYAAAKEVVVAASED